jgi:hypothetical protein
VFELMSEAKSPVEQVLDAMVFGPVGLLLAVRDRYPELAEQGRTELDKQVRTARMIGTFAVSAAQKEVAKRFAPRTAVAPPAAATMDQPIDGYDEMSAAQVIQYLGHCSAQQRLVVEVYERAHRKRQTILGRIEQLHR